MTGGAKAALELVRKWANARVQWGQEVGKHEAIAHRLAEIGATTFAMEAVSDLAQALADLHGYDIRLEAAAAKEWNTASAWKVIDSAMQVRGRPRLRDRAVARLPRGDPGRRRALDARHADQHDLRGLVGDHAPLHGPRGGGQAPQDRRARYRPEARG